MITMGNQFEVLDKVFNGDGVVSFSSGKLVVSSSSGFVSRASRPINVQRGDRVKYSVMARRVSADDDTTCYIKMLEIGTERNLVYINSADWRLYELTYEHNYLTVGNKALKIDFGIADGKSGSVEFADPRIFIENSAYGYNRVIACGLISGSAGSYSLISSYNNFGIRSIAYDAGTKELSIEADPTLGLTATSPLPFIQMGNPAGALTEHLTPKFTGYDPVTGVFKIKFHRADTGALVDISGWGTFSFAFKAEIN